MSINLPNGGIYHEGIPALDQDLLVWEYASSVIEENEKTTILSEPCLGGKRPLAERWEDTENGLAVEKDITYKYKGFKANFLTVRKETFYIKEIGN